MNEDIIEIIKGLEDLHYMGPASEEEIQLTEKNMHLKFAEDFKKYVSTFGAIIAKGIELTGITKSNQSNVLVITNQENDFNYSIPSNMYVVDDSLAEVSLILQDETGAIYELFPSGEITKKFSSLAEYILSLK